MAPPRMNPQGPSPPPSRPHKPLKRLLSFSMDLTHRNSTMRPIQRSYSQSHAHSAQANKYSNTLGGGVTVVRTPQDAMRSMAQTPQSGQYLSAPPPGSRQSTVDEPASSIVRRPSVNGSRTSSMYRSSCDRQSLVPVKPVGSSPQQQGAHDIPSHILADPCPDPSSYSTRSSRQPVDVEGDYLDQSVRRLILASRDEGGDERAGGGFSGVVPTTGGHMSSASGSSLYSTSGSSAVSNGTAVNVSGGPWRTVGSSNIPLNPNSLGLSRGPSIKADLTMTPMPLSRSSSVASGLRQGSLRRSPSVNNGYMSPPTPSSITRVAPQPFSALLLAHTSRSVTGSENATLVTIRFSYSLNSDPVTHSVTITLDTLRPAGGSLVTFLESQLRTPSERSESSCYDSHRGDRDSDIIEEFVDEAGETINDLNSDHVIPSFSSNAVKNQAIPSSLPPAENLLHVQRASGVGSGESQPSSNSNEGSGRPEMTDGSSAEESDFEFDDISLASSVPGEFTLPSTAAPDLCPVSASPNALSCHAATTPQHSPSRRERSQYPPTAYPTRSVLPPLTALPAALAQVRAAKSLQASQLSPREDLNHTRPNDLRPSATGSFAHGPTQPLRIPSNSSFTNLQAPLPTPAPTRATTPIRTLPASRRRSYTCPSLQVGTITELTVLIERDAGAWHAIASRLCSGTWPVMEGRRKRVIDECRWAGMWGLSAELEPRRPSLSGRPVSRGGYI